MVEKLSIELSQLRAVLETLACTVQGQSEPHQDTTVFNGRLLAGLLYEAGVRILAEDLLDYLSQHAGILVSSAPQEFHFVHRSFQEHLAACELTCEEPAKRIPPTSPDRRFPAGLVGLVCQRPDLWDNVLLLAADELLAHGREKEFWQLLANLCQPLVRDKQFAEAAMLAVQISDSRKRLKSWTGWGRLSPAAAWVQISDSRKRLKSLPEPELDEDGWLAVARMAQPLIGKAAEAILAEYHFTPEQRDIAGRLLGGDPFPGHDRRRGVGLRTDALPDIYWVEVRTLDREDGAGDWIYQNSAHEPLERYWIAKYPVTCAQFEVFLRAEDGFKDDRWWRGLEMPRGHRDSWEAQRFEYWNHPRERVSWYDAMAFCAWLTAKAKAHPGLLPKGEQGTWEIRLPTEEEWEKAARGRKGRPYPWGDPYKEGRANIDETEQGYAVGSHYLRKTSAVGMYPHKAPDDSPYGVADLSGNVWEWCLNEHASGKTDPGGDAVRVLRGGSWGFSHEFAASAIRRGFDPRDRSNNGGFRVVAVLSPPLALNSGTLASDL